MIPQVLLDILDTDGSGEIDVDEFVAFWNNAPPLRLGDEDQVCGALSFFILCCGDSFPAYSRVSLVRASFDSLLCHHILKIIKSRGSSSHQTTVRAANVVHVRVYMLFPALFVPLCFELAFLHLPF